MALHPQHPQTRKHQTKSQQIPPRRSPARGKARGIQLTVTQFRHGAGQRLQRAIGIVVRRATLWRQQHQLAKGHNAVSAEGKQQPQPGDSHPKAFAPAIAKRGRTQNKRQHVQGLLHTLSQLKRRCIHGRPTSRWCRPGMLTQQRGLVHIHAQPQNKRCPMPTRRADAPPKASNSSTISGTQGMRPKGKTFSANATSKLRAMNTGFTGCNNFGHAASFPVSPFLCAAAGGERAQARSSGARPAGAAAHGAHHAPGPLACNQCA